MGKKRKEDYLFEDWYNDQLELIQDPEDRAAFERFAKTPAGRETFKGYLREEHFHQKLNEVDKLKQETLADKAAIDFRAAEIDEWYAQNAPLNKKLIEEKSELVKRLEAAEAELASVGLVAEGQSRRGGSVSEDLERKIERLEKEREALETKVAQIDGQLPEVLGTFLDVAWKGMKEGYEVSPKQVLEHSIKKRIDPYAAFNELTEPERERREQERWTKELEKAREEGRREERKSLMTSPDRIGRPAPFPVGEVFKRQGVAPDRAERLDRATEAFMALGDEA